MRRSSRLAAKPERPPAWAALMKEEDEVEEEVVEEEAPSPPPRQRTPREKKRPAEAESPRDPVPDRRQSIDNDLRAAADTLDLNSHITVTRAKSQYHLNDGDLAGLRYSTAPNPHYRSAAPMKLYTLRDVVQRAYEKHGGAEGLAEADAASKRRKETIKQHRQDVGSVLISEGLGEFLDHPLVAEHRSTGRPGLQKLLAALRRERELKAALEARGLQLRGDSTLCANYIMDGDGNVNIIVNIMEEMRFYHKYTRYEYFRERARQIEMDWKGYYNPIEISDTAQRDAWEDIKKRKGRDWLLDLEDLPRTMRAELELELDKEAEEAEKEEEEVAVGGGGGVGVKEEAPAPVKMEEAGVGGVKEEEREAAVKVEEGGESGVKEEAVAAVKEEGL